MTENITSAKDWMLKYILPVIIIPIMTSYIVAYGAVKSMETQQINDGKRIDQIQSGTNINRVEISRVSSRVSKLEVLMENVDRTLTRQADISDKNLSEMRKMRSVLGDLKESVAVLKDRSERDEDGTN